MSDKPIAPEFVDTLAAHAAKTLEGWLEAHAAPKEIVDLLDATLVLTTYAADAAPKPVPDWRADSILSDVAHVSNLIVDLGGTFCAPDGETAARMPVKSKPAEESRRVRPVMSTELRQAYLESVKALAKQHLSPAWEAVLDDLYCVGGEVWAGDFQGYIQDYEKLLAELAEHQTN